MGKELARTLLAFYLTVGIYFALVMCMSAGIISLDTRIHVFVVALALWICTDVTLISQRAWGAHNRRVRIRACKKTPLKIRLPESIGFFSMYGFHTPRNTPGTCMDAYAGQWKSSNDMLRSGPLNAAYAAHVERYVSSLCYRHSCMGVHVTKEMMPYTCSHNTKYLSTRMST